MKPHLVRWNEIYGAKGLVIIDVDNGGFDTPEDLKASIAKAGVKFPTLWDRDGKEHEKRKVDAVPYAQLIGADGKVVWEGNPSPRDPSGHEKQIEAELAKAK